MRPLVCLVVVLICGCAKDPCGNVTDGFTIHAIRVPQGAQLDWTAVPADNYQIWAVDAASNPVATVTTKSVALTWPVRRSSPWRRPRRAARLEARQSSRAGAKAALRRAPDTFTGSY
jgi:hypothetical protein